MRRGHLRPGAVRVEISLQAPKVSLSTLAFSPFSFFHLHLSFLMLLARSASVSTPRRAAVAARASASTVPEVPSRRAALAAFAGGELMKRERIGRLGQRGRVRRRSLSCRPGPGADPFSQPSQVPLVCPCAAGKGIYRSEPGGRDGAPLFSIPAVARSPSLRSLSFSRPPRRLELGQRHHDPVPGVDGVHRAPGLPAVVDVGGEVSKRREKRIASHRSPILSSFR